MANRSELQTTLETLLGSRHVYYQPPENLKIEYPAIIYHKNKIDRVSANNSAYMINTNYEIIVVDKKPDNPVIEKLLLLPNSSFNRHYRSENLNHDVITLYY